MIMKRGDLIAAETSVGVKVFIKGKKLLKHEDKIVSEIEETGILINKVKAKKQ